MKVAKKGFERGSTTCWTRKIVPNWEKPYRCRAPALLKSCAQYFTQTISRRAEGCIVNVGNSVWHFNL